jgi:predicted  nucleic acid-binding Zn-ribbon protein
MSELTDYRRTVEQPHVARLQAKITDLHAKLGAAEGNAREQRDALLHFGQGWQRRAETAEGRIERAREVLAGHSAHPENRAFEILTEPANAEGIASSTESKFAAAQRLTLEDAEGIASEGGLVSANPRDLPADAPSAEAGQP